MKVSEITTEDIANYLRLDDTEEAISPLLDAAKSFVQSYTGLSQEEIDTHDDFYIVIMVLCQDMYDNRCLYVDKNNLNKVVDAVLGMHCTNLL
jgi:hypothetical protein